MQQPTVTMIIHGDGSGFDVDVKGVKGPACQKIQKDFESFGVRVRESKKPEYNQVQATVNTFARR